MKLEYILTRIRIRRWELNHQAFIDRLARGFAEAREFGAPRPWQPPYQCLSHMARLRSGDAHDADASAPGGGRYGGYGVARYLIAWHGQACRD
jgi:hypothetical protein